MPKRVRTYLDTPFYFSEAIANSSLPGNDPLANEEDNSAESGAAQSRHTPSGPQHNVQTLPDVQGDAEHDQEGN